MTYPALNETTKSQWKRWRNSVEAKKIQGRRFAFSSSSSSSSSSSHPQATARRNKRCTTVQGGEPHSHRKKKIGEEKKSSGIKARRDPPPPLLLRIAVAGCAMGSGHANATLFMAAKMNSYAHRWPLTWHCLFQYHPEMGEKKEPEQFLFLLLFYSRKKNRTLESVGFSLDLNGQFFRENGIVRRTARPPPHKDS